MANAIATTVIYTE